jgi:excinuclease ABC subunit A
VTIDKLVVRGAREHNLKNVSIELPRNALIVFTGLSGSGKSSLKDSADMLNRYLPTPVSS